MINSRKKGFTLVELVIVIAVVAVLAAVLIPTFANLVKRANLSADEQAVRQINTLLATEFVTEKPETLKEVVDMLDENGYNTDALIPLTKGYSFVWNKETNTISLVLNEKVDENAETLEDGKSYINKEVGTFDQFLVALQNGSDVTLTNDIIIEDAMKVYGDVTIDTKGYKIDASKTGRPFEMTSNSSLAINFGNEIFKTGEFGLIDIKQNVKNVNITINGGKFESQLNWGAFIKIREGADNINITLNDVIYTDTSTDSYIMNCDGFKGSLNLTVNNGIFKSAFGFQVNGNATFKNTTIETLGYGIYITKKSTISNCTFKLGNTPEPPQNVPAAAVVVSNQGELTVDNCTVNGEAPYGFVILNSGGTILATNNNITASKDYDLNGGSTGALNDGKTAKIIVDGETRLNR